MLTTNRLCWQLFSALNEIFSNKKYTLTNRTRCIRRRGRGGYLQKNYIGQSSIYIYIKELWNRKEIRPITTLPIYIELKILIRVFNYVLNAYFGCASGPMISKNKYSMFMLMFILMFSICKKYLCIVAFKLVVRFMEHTWKSNIYMLFRFWE